MASLWRRIVLSCKTCPCLLTYPLFSIHFSSHTHTLTLTPSPSPSPPLLHPPISLFLLTECDFSPSQLSKIMKTQKSLLKTRSTHTAQEAVEFLKQHGFTQPQIHTTIRRHPTILALKVDTQLKPKFNFFGTLGFTDQELRNLISKYPRVVNNNLESSIIPMISFLENLFGSKPNLFKALKRSPALLTGSVEKLKPNLDLLKQWGIQGELLLRLVSNTGGLVKYSTETLRVRMEYATSTMGIVQGTKTFVSAIRQLLCNAPQNVEKKMKNLQGLGLLEDEVRELLKKNPNLLSYSTNRIQENMNFLTQTAGFKLNDVFSNSYLLHYSVRKRLMPRHAIFKAISSEQQSVSSLLTIFKLTEPSFLQKIVECYPQASKLKEIYKSKMESADIGTTS